MKLANLMKVGLHIVGWLVVAVLALNVLALFVGPHLGAPPSEATRRRWCESNLKHLYRACESYAREHNGHYPSALSDLHADGAPAAALFCPLPKRRGMDLPRDEINSVGSYVIMKGVTTNSHADTILACDKIGNHPGGVNVLFVDGRVQ